MPIGNIIYIDANNITSSEGNQNATSTAATDVVNTTIFDLDYQFVYVPTTVPTDAQACAFRNITTKNIYRNGTVSLVGSETRTCRFNNGTSQVRTINYNLYYQPGGAVVGPTSVTVVSTPVQPGDVSGVPVQSTGFLQNGRRRLLMEAPRKTAKHFQSFNTTTTVTGTGNYIWVSCFTGFGEVSLININAIVDNQPTMEQCIQRIAQERPNYTVDRLRTAVNNYLAQNPGAV